MYGKPDIFRLTVNSSFTTNVIILCTNIVLYEYSTIQKNCISNNVFILLDEKLIGVIGS